MGVNNIKCYQAYLRPVQVSTVWLSSTIRTAKFSLNNESLVFRASRNRLSVAASAEAYITLNFPWWISSKQFSFPFKSHAVNPIEFTSTTWSRIILCNREITMMLEKPAPPQHLLRTPHIMTNIWKIKLFPNPVGSTAITSLPLKRWRNALSCSFFDEKAIPLSFSFNITSLKHDLKSSGRTQSMKSMIDDNRWQSMTIDAN